MPEPLSLADAKSHLRIKHSAEDGDITSLIVAVRKLVERESWRAIVRESRTAVLTGFPRGSEPLYLPRPPLVSVESVSYLDPTDGTASALTGFRVDAEHEPGCLWPPYGENWPETRWDPAAVTVTFTAGYADGAVPEDVVHCLKLKLAELYEGRSPSVSERMTTYDRVLNLIKFRDGRIRGTLLGDVQSWPNGVASR